MIWICFVAFVCVVLLVIILIEVNSIYDLSKSLYDKLCWDEDIL